MNKKSIEILEKIIANKGSCDKATSEECKICPLGNSNNLNGGTLGCIDNLKIRGLSLEEADKKYLDAAMSALADLKIEEILEENSVPNK